MAELPNQHPEIKQHQELLSKLIASHTGLIDRQIASWVDADHEQGDKQKGRDEYRSFVDLQLIRIIQGLSDSGLGFTNEQIKNNVQNFVEAFLLPDEGEGSLLKNAYKDRQLLSQSISELLEREIQTKRRDQNKQARVQMGMEDDFQHDADDIMSTTRSNLSNLLG